MNSNPELYLPWSAITDWCTTNTRQIAATRPRHRPAARVDELDSGCLLYSVSFGPGARTTPHGPTRLKSLRVIRADRP